MTSIFRLTTFVKKLQWKKLILTTSKKQHKVQNLNIWQSILCYIMTKMQAGPANNLLPPSRIRGMKVLDKSKFTKTIKIPTLLVETSNLYEVLKPGLISKHLLCVTKIQPIAHLNAKDPDRDIKKLILLNPKMCPAPDELNEQLKLNLMEANIDIKSWQLMLIDLNFENWNYKEILRAILPEDSDIGSGFTQIGHIAHLNLFENLAEYKLIIGDVILSSQGSVKTVVNKSEGLSNTYRNSSLELIGGERNFITTVKADNLLFKMNYNDVFWNSKLCVEHKHLVDSFLAEDVVFDVFAGIGPYALRAAKKGCTVYANDLNPSAYEWLNKNCELNQDKLKKPIQTFNMDGRAFINTIVKRELETLLSNEDSVDKRVHIVMNLPASAMEFTDSFLGLLEQFCMPGKIPEITVYCYCFESEKFDRAIIDLLKEKLGDAFPMDYNKRFVREIGYGKNEYCMTFNLSKDILCDVAKSYVPSKQLKI